MIFHDFQYLRPHSLKQALALVSAHQGCCRVLAGGTDLLLRLKQGDVAPGVIVDLKGVGLNRVAFEGTGAQGTLTIGALATLAEIIAKPEVGQHYPALYQALIYMASTQVRNRATLGGNLCNAAPSADTAPPLMIYEARARLEQLEGKISPAGLDDLDDANVLSISSRELPVEQLFAGPGVTVLGPAEVVTEVTVPLPLPGTGSAYVKLRRTEKDIALVGVAALIQLDNQGACAQARVALGAVAPTPVRAAAAEAELVGSNLDESVVTRAAKAAAQDARPIDDVRASARYRRDMVEVLTKEAVTSAVADARARWRRE